MFFDEVDAIGGARSDDGAGGGNEVQRAMLELITQFDGAGGDTKSNELCLSSSPIDGAGGDNEV
jgi:ATP-dependent 26S proteasome regulatory subunit